MPKGHPWWRQRVPKCPQCGAPVVGGWVDPAFVKPPPEATEARAAQERGRAYDKERFGVFVIDKPRPHRCRACGYCFTFDPKKDETAWHDTRRASSRP